MTETERVTDKTLRPGSTPAPWTVAAQKQRAQLKSPPLDVDRYLDALLRQGLVQTVKAPSAYRAIL